MRGAGDRGTVRGVRMMMHGGGAGWEYGAERSREGWEGVLEAIGRFSFAGFPEVHGLFTLGVGLIVL